MGVSAHSHHSTRRRARDENLGRVGLVSLQGIANHVGDAVAVGAAIVSHGSFGADVPASSTVGTLGIDDDEALLIRKLGIRRTLVV